MKHYNEITQKLFDDAKESSHARMSVNYGLILDGWMENGFFHVTVRRKRGRLPSSLELGCLLKAFERLFGLHPISVEKQERVFVWTWKTKEESPNVETS